MVMMIDLDFLLMMARQLCCSHLSGVMKRMWVPSTTLSLTMMDPS
ncbi:hypothetical protein M6B38_126755 [Iris pallida]|uniref:Uncharacterized protein n=1 Tax=Iris pallida TaxID=29817 RepID=A0AAX6GDV5_IRIPA|nr:hypothetical protein M6B38_371170 [Iris pallida]KAJ6827529.1 hypothetical protein M6B38_126755 [Iris pallida]